MMYRGRFLLTAALAALTYSVTPATVRAADLGGGCCGDLEERIAELEATTARKGNRVVSLSISGQVNRALLIWDDGVDSDAFVVDPDSDGSRFRFTGKAQIKPGWTAGYIMEFNVVDTASNAVSQLNDEGADNAGFNIRQNGLYIESERLGRLSIGQLAQATDGINETSVVTTYSTVGKAAYAGAFELRSDVGILAGTGVLWGDLVNAIGGSQDDIVRYDTPAFYGFILSASWGDNDIFDVALNFQKQFNSVKLQAGIGYLSDQRDVSVSFTDEQVSGSISAIHVPTGLFATFAAGTRSFKNGADDAENIYVQAGVSRKWLPYGDTTFWADYANFEGSFGGRVTFDIDAGGVDDTLVSSEAQVWGLGVVQSFDSAALNIYALAQFFSADVVADLNAGGAAALNTEDHYAIVIGSHIKF